MNRLFVSIYAISLAYLALGCESSSKPATDTPTELGGGTSKGSGDATTGGRSSTDSSSDTKAKGGSSVSAGGTSGAKTEGSTGGTSENKNENGGSGVGGAASPGNSSGGAKATSNATKATTGGAKTGGGGSPSAAGSPTPIGAAGATRVTPRPQGGAAGGPVKVGTGGTPVGAGGSNAVVVPNNPPPAEDFTDKVGSASIDMIAIPGGTFTLGCETSSCDTDTSPVENITVSPYHIMKGHAAKALWTATGLTEGTWYDCMALACELGKQTGHAYRMMTEAEFEYAAKKHLDKLTQVDATEEWAFNSWETKYTCKPGDVDPLGPGPGAHTQKTRRDKATGDKITGRLIRSIDGIGPSCRLVVSDKVEYPAGYPASCNIKPPVATDEPENSYRDPRWVTGDSNKWKKGSIAIGNFDLQTWDDGTALMNGKPGQWFTSNNIAFVFVPSSGTAVKYPYMFLDANQGSVISDAGFTTGFIGRFEKTTASGSTKPTISGLKSGEELATAAGADFKMIDMSNIPESAKKQDPRLLDTATDCWFQNNQSAGGTHNYRKDVDADEFRFAVIDKGQVIMLANGTWWTVNNTFLHIQHKDGYVAEYLYAVTSDGYFFHDSYMGYERADFRMFQKYDNATGKYPATCISDSCSKELAKGAAEPFYDTMADGKSTFVPAKCPAAGCK